MEPVAPSFLRALPLAHSALEYAQAMHAGQRRDSDHAPFILHPLEVASLLHNTGHPETVVAAGILHDTVEDSEAATEDIEARFGPKVTELVRAMTEDPTIEPFPARKAALRDQIAAYGDGAISVYAADKVTKVRELRARHADAPGAARLHHYEQSLEMLEAQAPDHPLVRQLRFELEALRALPPVR